MPLFMIERSFAEQLDVTDDDVRLIEGMNAEEGAALGKHGNLHRVGLPIAPVPPLHPNEPTEGLRAPGRIRAFVARVTEMARRA